MTVPTGIRCALRPAAVLGVLLLGFHLAHGQLGFGGRSLNSVSDDWVYDGVILGAACACLLRGWIVREDRLAWLVLGAGFAADATGEIYYSLAFGDSSTPSIPSFDDLFYLLYYPAAYIALVLLIRKRVRRFSPSTWLDGGIAAMTAAAVVAALVFEPILRGATHGDAAAVATTIAYPVGDVLLLAIVLGFFALSGWRPGRTWLLLGAGLGLTAIADTAYLYENAQGTYVVGGVLDSLWIAAALCTGFAAWQNVSSSPPLRLEGRRLLVMPGVFGLSALAVLLYGGFHHVGTLGLACAGAAVLLVILRAAWTFGEYMRLLESSRHDAVTDALTGIGNRRKLHDELQRALARGPSSEPAALVLYDLDGFKRYNDSFGHLAGDTLLAHFGRRLRDAIGDAGDVYRLGGDEFCAILHGELDDTDERVTACAAALVAAGEGFSVSASYGRVALPREAETPTRALRLADDRMYAHKGGRLGSARQQAHDVLLGLLREREPELHDHLRAVGRLAVVVGRRLGMNTEQLDELRRAAELHDVGKAAIPDEILAKPGRLDEHEAVFMRRHTLIGERILSAAPALAPVAELVRSSHERWDGAGYPDRLAGPAIPLGARIIAVCDAFDAITSERPYTPPRTPMQALEELRRGAGAQFDPDVVEAFVLCWHEQTRCEHRAAGGEPVVRA